MDAEQKANAIPLFMQRCIISSASGGLPIEGQDYVYNPDTQKAEWLSPTMGNTWKRTMYGDAVISDHTY